MPEPNHNDVPRGSTPEPRKAGAAQAWVLILTMFLPIMAIIALAPALPTLFKHFHDVPDAEVRIPMLLTAPALCIVIFSPFAGALSDRFGRRRLLLTAMFLYGIGGVMPLVFPEFWQVMTGRLILGVAEAFLMTVGNALLADYFAPDERRKWLSMQGIVGPILATLLLAGSGRLAAQGWQYPFTVYLFAFPIFAFSYFFVWEPEKREAIETESSEPTTTTFPSFNVGMVSLVTLFIANIYWVYTINFGRMLSDLGYTDQTVIGNISAISSLGVPVGAFLYRRIGKWEVSFLLATTLLFLGVGFITIGALHSYNATVLGSWIQQIGAGLTVPVLVSWNMSYLTHQHRGKGMGIWTSCFFICNFLSPVVVANIGKLTGGLLGTATAVGVVAIIGGVVSILIRTLNRPPRKPLEN